jgi:hypothetical protein
MRDQSIRKSARSSTAVLVWTTVQQEKRSSGPAAHAVHRYGAEPSSHLPEAPDTSQLECQQSRQRRRGRRASGGCLRAPTSSRARPGSARCGASRVPASTSIEAAVSDPETRGQLPGRSAQGPSQSGDPFRRDAATRSALATSLLLVLLGSPQRRRSTRLNRPTIRPGGCFRWRGRSRSQVLSRDPRRPGDTGPTG